MRDALLAQYERELSYLRRTGSEFAKRYPKIASRLLLEPSKCDDPHVERLLEGFAFLSARVQLKLEDDFPEFSEALLEVVYPHYARPIPSLSIVQFHLDPDQGKLPDGLSIAPDALLHSRPVAGATCRFRCCYPTTIWPIEVAGARWGAPYELRPPLGAPGAAGALALDLRAPADLGFGQLNLGSLRLHLNAEANLATTLYELLCNNLVEIVVRDPTPGSKLEPIFLPPTALRPVGFAPDEGLLPYGKRSFVGYRLLQEYFAFPEKFLFFELSGLERLRAEEFGSRAEVVFLFSPFGRPERRAMLEAGVSADTIRLNCTPIINVFPQTAEPILLDQKHYEYRIVPEGRLRVGTGVYSVEDVVAITPDASEPVRFEPFYSLHHAGRHAEERFWYARRRPTGWRADEGTDVFLSFVDRSGVTARPHRTAITARLLCYNGDLPSRLPFGDPTGDFELPGGGPIRRIVALVKPTEVIHPPLGRAQLWRLVSQLSLNYTSLVDGGADALKELLRLHNSADSEAGEKQIQGILQVRGGPAYSRVESEYGLTFARGQRVEVDFDEEQFAGGGVYLLANVLNHFLGLTVSLNSFCTLVARSRQRKGTLAEWAPRSGWKTLL
ncbi:MAG: type VI secretion system baseplate subunit TssF [Gemmatimonas sp.]|nr:type VI secretion system baseplate subunit TssF [Gemmatimonas sp.]